MLLIRIITGACLLEACSALSVGSPAALAGGEKDDFGLTEDEWLGLDADDEMLAAAQNGTLNMAAAGANTTLNSTVWGDPDVFIMGLFNVGTNLLNKLVAMNGLATKPCEAGMHLWKHVKPSLLYQRFQSEGRPNTLKDKVAIMIVRDPMSWLQSMRKAPYDLRFCMQTAEWPTKSCTFPKPEVVPSTIWRDPTRVAHKEPFPVSNVESVWNEWTQQYDQLTQYGFSPGKTLVVSYEEIVLDTEGVMDRIAHVLGKPAPSSVKQLHSAAKTHGYSNGRARALAKLNGKTYMTSYSDQQRHQVCQLLDKSLMGMHGYHDCDGWF